AHASGTSVIGVVVRTDAHGPPAGDALLTAEGCADACEDDGCVDEQPAASKPIPVRASTRSLRKSSPQSRLPPEDGHWTDNVAAPDCPTPSEGGKDAREASRCATPQMLAAAAASGALTRAGRG